MAKKSDKATALFAGIRKNIPLVAPSLPSSEEIQEPQIPVPRGGPGKHKLIYFSETDSAILREKTVWVASQGIRPSDSLILRAALLAAKPDQNFREALDVVLSQDQRSKSARQAKKSRIQ